MKPDNAKLCPCPGDVAAKPAAGPSNFGDCGPCAHKKCDYSRLNDWLESTVSCSWHESENEDHAALWPPQIFQTNVATFERYESIDEVRPDSDPGILTEEDARGDGPQRVENFIRNTIDESKVIALGWQEQSWAMPWDGILLDRQAEEGRIWDSEIATRWRARLDPGAGKDARGQTVSLRQIYMDKHAKVLPSTPTFIIPFTRHMGRAMPGAIRRKRLSSGAPRNRLFVLVFRFSFCLSSTLVHTRHCRRYLPAACVRAPGGRRKCASCLAMQHESFCGCQRQADHEWLPSIHARAV
jgi:hypothetical protein